MRFCVLGPVGIECGGSFVELRGPAQRALLAALLVGRGAPVRAEALTYELWGENWPRRPDNALHAQVSRLRRRLDALEPGRSGGPRLVSSSAGYRLLLREDELDIAVFTRELREVGSDPGMSPEQAVQRLRGALALWRGPAFGGTAAGPASQAAAVRFEESRVAALALLFDSELRAGRHAEIVAELSELVEAQPLNERLCEQLMVALYRSGRQTAALTVYQRTWARLNEELGIEPSPALRNHQRAILAHDPALHADANHALLRTA
ncbi:MAG TPA: AfsR/SARP family transcriptional regulator [Micromonosporaceae bacterium]|nr:AfsR/SARP family transcriptional regulator [Micromonosporaceae bacterium]